MFTKHQKWNTYFIIFTLKMDIWKTLSMWEEIWNWALALGVTHGKDPSLSVSSCWSLLNERSTSQGPQEAAGLQASALSSVTLRGWLEVPDLHGGVENKVIIHETYFYLELMPGSGGDAAWKGISCFLLLSSPLWSPSCMLRDKSSATELLSWPRALYYCFTAESLDLVNR